MIFCQGNEWITVQNLGTSMLSISYTSSYTSISYTLISCTTAAIVAAELANWRRDMSRQRCRCSWVPFCAFHFHFHIFINWKIKLFAISRRVFLCLPTVLVCLPSLFRLLHSLCVCQRQKQWRKTIKESEREREGETENEGSNRKIETFVWKSVLWFVGLSLC